VRGCSEGVALLKLAVEKDSRMDHAFFLLALCYLHGDGVSPCAEEAARLLLTASQLHNPAGRSPKTHPSQTLNPHYFSCLPLTLFSAAQSQLGMLYYNGLGVARDVGRALHWLRLAAAQGDEEAACKLEDIAGTAEIERADVLGSSLRHFSAACISDLARCVAMHSAAQLF
jgi:TPR repeat protein